MIFLHQPAVLQCVLPPDKGLDGHLHDEDQEVEQADQHPQDQPVRPAQLAQATGVTDLSVVNIQDFVLIRVDSRHSEKIIYQLYAITMIVLFVSTFLYVVFYRKGSLLARGFLLTELGLLFEKTFESLREKESKPLVPFEAC